MPFLGDGIIVFEIAEAIVTVQVCDARLTGRVGNKSFIEAAKPSK